MRVLNAGSCRDDGILAEESVDDDRRLSCERVWMVDPLDGTKFYGNKILGSDGAPGNRSKGPRGGWNGGGYLATKPGPNCALMPPDRVQRGA